MRHQKSITTELNKLLDRHKELLEEHPAPTVRQLVEKGAEPAEAAQQVQTAPAKKIQRELELEAVQDRIAEVVDELSAVLANRKQKLESDADSKLHNALLRWMSGTGQKLFEDQAIRERTFIHSDDAKPAIAAAQKAAHVPVVRGVSEDFKWFNNRVRLPLRRDLGNNEARTIPFIERDEMGHDFEGLDRLIELLEKKS